ncbi:Plant invertase/pectin methylesterase inhibitor superfamily protein [Abeliophyllum distichum]|uniref:Plant invertase/pectin methylesterase inhibitor superfamily protein n=1 Tax=Abeliophyllum distichum TaxID=126358 RepID=A0ABD1UPZ1_9LAMI
MARTILTFSLIFLSLFYVPTKIESTKVAATSPATNFIKASCSATTYPILCVKSLSVYASSIQRNPRQLVETALTVSLERAQSTKTFVARLTKFKGLKPRERAAIKDCFEEMSDNVDRLSMSIKELKSMGQARGKEFIWHMSNIETWVSAALTDDSTCVDGFSGRTLNGRIKSSIKARMTNLAQVTSNALALCNHFAEKY